MTGSDVEQSGPFARAGDDSGLRADAGAILRAGLEAADPGRAVRAALERRAPVWQGARRVFILAMGKAADAMAEAAAEVLRSAVAGGVVVGPTARTAHSGLLRLMGDHPLPGAGSVRAGAAVADLAARTGPGDLVVCLISGGASALVAFPPEGLSIETVAETTDRLLRAGASIHEINRVRRRLDRLKGGRLTRRLAPARVLGLLVSDVPGDRIADIASGPLVADPTTSADARAVLDRYGIGGPVRDALLDDDLPEPAHPSEVEVIVSARQALDAAAVAARELGYRVDADPAPFSGEARALGERLAIAVTSGRGRRALVRAGETTVTVTGDGRGGRNQEVALGAVERLHGHRHALVAALGTDGVDGPTDAAGAVATGATLERAHAAALDPADALRRNDAWSFFRALDDLIVTGPTGTNVMDLVVALADD